MQFRIIHILGADIMAISGRIELEELVIEFTKVDLRYRVRITCKGVVSEYFCNSRDLTATIAVAIHPDGPEQRFQQFIP